MTMFLSRLKCKKHSNKNESRVDI